MKHYTKAAGAVAEVIAVTSVSSGQFVYRDPLYIETYTFTGAKFKPTAIKDLRARGFRSQQRGSSILLYKMAERATITIRMEPRLKYFQVEFRG